MMPTISMNQPASEPAPGGAIPSITAARPAGQIDPPAEPTLRDILDGILRLNAELGSILATLG